MATVTTSNVGQTPVAVLVKNITGPQIRVPSLRRVLSSLELQFLLFCLVVHVQLLLVDQRLDGHELLLFLLLIVPFVNLVRGNILFVMRLINLQDWVILDEDFLADCSVAS